MLINGVDLKIHPGANLKGAYLYGANLEGAYLYGANLGGANLGGANLGGAYLRGAYLYGANLRGTYLRGADLRGADLRGADLYGANLYGTNLRSAYLEGANLRSAYLEGANLEDAHGLATFRITPDGAFLAYKKLASGEVAIVNVPYEAKRVNAYGSRKIRVSQLRVEEVTGLSNGLARTGTHRPGLVYEPGATLVCDDFDPSPLTECSRGLHVFLTREEAEAWT